MPKPTCKKVKDVGPLGIFASARTSSIREMARKYISARGACEQRGYHEVSQDTRDPLMCYHCDLWFGKKDSKSMGIIYRVVNN